MVGKRLLRSHLIIYRKTNLKALSQPHVILPKPSMEFESHPNLLFKSEKAISFT